MNRLTIPLQLLAVYLNIGVSSLMTLFFEYSSKFMYLFMMNSEKKEDFRNQVVSRIRHLRSLEDPLDEMSLTKIKVIEFYAWLCKHQ